MEVADKIAKVREFLRPIRQQGKSIGFVPTMGALHDGHLALIKRAREETECVVVSIFVNPLQFCPNEDYDKYPRRLEEDLRLCENSGVDLVFSPSVEEIYPREQLTIVSVRKLTETLCGRSRPGHFDGVTTVVTKLFNIVQPDIAYFGQKDAQQAVVIKRMVEDLNFPIEIVVVPTVRDEYGLALSSRNEYLSPEEKIQARSIYMALKTAEEKIKEGEKDAHVIIDTMRQIIESAGPFRIDYISIVELETLQEVDRIDSLPVMVAVAVYIGKARLIDNIIIRE